MKAKTCIFDGESYRLEINSKRMKSGYVQVKYNAISLKNQHSRGLLLVKPELSFKMVIHQIRENLYKKPPQS